MGILEPSTLLFGKPSGFETSWACQIPQPASVTASLSLRIFPSRLAATIRA